tara:strand:+ start:147 stop:1109 length:963 start_codon:yes stop_codon:yes gene_type:complete
MKKIPATQIYSFQELILNVKYNEALLISSSLINNYPEDPQSFTLHGIAHNQLNEFDKALVFFEKSRDLGCSKKEYFTNLSALNTRKGNFYYNNNKFNTALKYFLKAIDYNSENLAGNYSNLGNCYSKLGETDKAEINYKKALKISPKFIINHINLANLYIEIKDFILAEKHSRIASELDPIQPFYARVLASSLVYQNKLDEALLVYKKLVMTDGLNHISYYDVAKTLFDLERYDELIDFLKNNDSISLKKASLLNFYGLAYFKLGNYKDSLIFLEKAILIKPNFLNIYLNLISVYETLGDNENIKKYSLIAERISKQSDK